jgi:outer membrane protein with beta-barrel domain
MRSAWLRLFPIFTVLIPSFPAAALAQATASAPVATVKEAGFDAGGYLAWFRANRGGIGGDSFRDWFATPRLSVGVGRYWTAHLKTEAELAITRQGNLFSVEQLESEPRVSRYLYRNHTYEIRTLSVVQAWQFRRNAWIHPFVGAGIDVDWEKRTVETTLQVSDSRTDQVPSMTTLTRETRAEVIPRAVAIAGLKAYFARNAFFRTDVHASFRERLDQVAWRFGVGWDF